jgi:hypothetical protein
VAVVVVPQASVVKAVRRPEAEAQPLSPVALTVTRLLRRLQHFVQAVRV